MVARTLWKELVIRALLIAVIVFNALAPTAVVAKSSTTQDNFVNSSEKNDGKKQEETNSLPSVENNYNQPRFPHPVSRVAEKTHRSESTVAQTSDAMLICYSDNCTDAGPGVVLTEVVDDA